MILILCGIKLDLIDKRLLSIFIDNRNTGFYSKICEHNIKLFFLIFLKYFTFRQKIYLNLFIFYNFISFLFFFDKSKQTMNNPIMNENLYIRKYTNKCYIEMDFEKLIEFNQLIKRIREQKNDGNILM